MAFAFDLFFHAIRSLNVCYFISLFRRLGWDPKPGESHLDSMLRGELLTALASFGHESTLDEANKRFRIFLEDRNATVLPPDLRRVSSNKKFKNLIIYNRNLIIYPAFLLTSSSCFPLFPGSICCCDARRD